MADYRQSTVCFGAPLLPPAKRYLAEGEVVISIERGDSGEFIRGAVRPED